MRFTPPQQQRLMRFLPIVFGLLLIRFPAGLFVYWITSNLITYGQNCIIYRSSPAENDPSEVQKSTENPKGPSETQIQARPIPHPRPSSSDAARSTNAGDKPSDNRTRKRRAKKKR